MRLENPLDSFENNQVDSGELQPRSEADLNINRQDLEKMRQGDKKEVEMELSKLRESLPVAVLDTEDSQKASSSVEESRPKASPEARSWLEGLRRNKWLKRAMAVSAIGLAALIHGELKAQEKKEPAASGIVKESDQNNQDNIEMPSWEGENPNEFALFAESIGKIIEYSDINPDKKILRKWSPGGGSSQYYNENLAVYRQGEKAGTEEGVVYDVTFTKNASGRLMNFDFIRRDQGVVTRTPYNELYSDSVWSIRYTYQEQPGFQRITAREFEGLTGFVVTEPGFREDMDNNFVWIDNNIDNEGITSSVLDDFGADSDFVNLEKD